MRKSLTALVICALLVVLFGQTVWAAPSTCPCTPCHKVVHVVRWGENLWRISRWYGTTVEAIAHANGILNPHCIYAGDRLVIPCAASCPTNCPHPCPCKEPCDCNVPCEECDEPDEDQNQPDPDDNVPCPECGHHCKDCHHACPKCGHPCKPGHGGHCGWHHPHHGFYYTVRWGDTLSGIAWRFGVNMWSIVHANRIANPNCIYAGTQLYIP